MVKILLFSPGFVKEKHFSKSWLILCKITEEKSRSAEADLLCMYEIKLPG